MCQVHTGYETPVTRIRIRSQSHSQEKKRKKYCHYLTWTSAAILLSASSVVLIIPSFAKPLPKNGIPDISTFHSMSIFVVLTLDEGLSASVLVPVTGPSVIFVSTTNCSGFTVTN